MYDIKCDIHTHTLYSRHSYSTIAENVEYAAAAGLELLGSADHFSGMLHPGHDFRDYQFFINVGVWPRVWKGVTLLRAAEADILGLKGELYGMDIPVPTNITGRVYKSDRTLYDRVTEKLDYLVASVHNKDFAEGATLAQGTEMYIKCLENPKVFVLGHTGRADVPYDIDEVVTVAKEKHKLIELNEHTFDSDKSGKHRKICTKIAERCAELGCGVTISTDAHICTGIGQFPCSRAFLEEIHFPQELIMNRDRKTLLGELKAAGITDLTSLA